jgi:hypothetical protein
MMRGAMPRFALQVPVDAPYRALAADVAARYVEMAGGAASDAATIAAAITSAIDELSAERPAAHEVHLEFVQSATGLDVTIRCGDRSRSLRNPLPARKH